MTRGRSLRTSIPSLPCTVCTFHAGTFPGNDVGADGAEIPVEHPIVQTLVRASTEGTGRAPAFSGRTGGADTRYLIKHGQTPTVIFGPGQTAQMHALDECVPVDNLVVATTALALTIADWCGVR